MRILTLGLTAGLLVMALAAKGAEPPADVELIGVWQGVSQDSGEEQKFDAAWDVKPGTFDVLIDGQTWSTWKYEVDPEQKPKTIDLTVIKAGEGVGRTVKGIYKVERNKLTVCKVRDDVTDPQKRDRPTAFDNQRKDVVILKFERQQP